MENTQLPIDTEPKPKKARKYQKQDRKLVAYHENDHEEVKYIAKKLKIPIAKVREAITSIHESGKPARSRKEIYLKMVDLGLITDLKKFISQTM